MLRLLHSNQPQGQIPASQGRPKVRTASGNRRSPTAVTQLYLCHTTISMAGVPPIANLPGMPLAFHQLWQGCTVYQHEPQNIGIKSEPSRLDTKPCFTDWLLQNVRKILDTTDLPNLHRLGPKCEQRRGNRRSPDTPQLGLGACVPPNATQTGCFLQNSRFVIFVQL